MLEAPALQENAFDGNEAPISKVQVAGTFASQVSAHERIVEAKRLVEAASRLLGTESSEEPFGLRLARGLVLSLLDELAILAGRAGR